MFVSIGRWQRFAAVIMRIRDPKTTALIFRSGKMVVTGAKCALWTLPCLWRTRSSGHLSSPILSAFAALAFADNTLAEATRHCRLQRSTTECPFALEADRTGCRGRLCDAAMRTILGPGCPLHSPLAIPTAVAFCRSEEAARNAARKYARIIQKLDFPVGSRRQQHKPCVHNIGPAACLARRRCIACWPQLPKLALA